MALNIDLFLRQTWALTKKNLTIAIVRCWFSTIIRALVIPIALVTICLEIPNFGGGDHNTYGVGSPAPVMSLADSLSDGKKLAIVETPGLGPDFPDVYNKITGPLDSSLILHVDSANDVHTACDVDFHGNSNCHAVIIFNDSPLSGRPNATWNYTLLVDPARLDGAFNVLTHADNIESFLYPLQLAVENAMANSSATPEALAYAYINPTEAAQSAKDDFLDMALDILSFVFFISMCTMVHHVSSLMGKERQRGLSQLADAMSGGMSAARVVSYIITFDVLYLPTWIILGSLYTRLLCPTTSAAVFIFWQIFTGWAVTSASVFAAAFFTSEALTGTIVPGLSLLLAVLAAWQDDTNGSPPMLGETVGLSLFFPSCSFVFFFDFAVKAEMLGQPVDLVAALPLPVNPNDIQFPWQINPSWVNQISPIVLWVLLIVQIFGYLALAIVVEHFLHGNNRRHRSFHTDETAEASHAAIETTNLEKYYMPSLWRRIFCCARAPATKAVDGLSLTSHKQQILCLLGPNGSGKTTTLDMMSGLTAPTTGSIRINAAPAQIGVCPQKNVLWDNLTVYEHLLLWNTLKGAHETAEELAALLETCDLALKKTSLAGNLSGGMKRKLQLACMLVGGSSVCLMDEVTSGLDPISRRVIWNAVLRERTRRTMVLTTHFLDECEVLSDHIVIVSLGKLKCQGMPAELKAQYGGGYRVHIPKEADISLVEYPVVDRGDRYVATTPDSSSAAKLLSLLEEKNVEGLFITGPTIEDVFLAVSEEPHTLNGDSSEGPLVESSLSPAGPASTLTGRRLFFRQFGALFIKRCLVLRSQWWLYILVLAIPIVFSTSSVVGFFLSQYVPPTCAGLLTAALPAAPISIFGDPFWVIGPEAANASIVAAAAKIYTQAQQGNPYGSLHPFTVGPESAVQNTSAGFLSYIANNSQDLYDGGIFLGNGSAPLVAAAVESYSGDTLAIMNVANAARTGVSIAMYFGELLSLELYQGSSVVWISIVCLLHTVWPAFFALYPTYERKARVRALQYSNGVTALPLWLSYALFDFMFILVISVICTALILPQSQFWGIGYIALVLLLYGIAAMLVAYILSMFASSQPAACALAIVVMIVEYIISSIVIITSATGVNFSQATLDGTTYGLGIIFPIQNLMRAYMLGLNQFIVRCRGTTSVDDPGSIYAYGGPILLLIIQIIAFFFILLYLDGSVFTLHKSKTPTPDNESDIVDVRVSVKAERTRVEISTDDLLRILHVSKNFGACKAVDDVSLGLQKGEILALLGPNGAGKTTIINMIRGELPPTSGDIFLENVSVQSNTRLAQARLGVCPQFDALDLLTVREHLTFYARCKGVSDIDADVAFVMAKVGITVHADKLAAKLSGGNKRKLSLAIALLGSPPVLLLDEPSTAMDAASKRVFWKTLEAVAPGRSVMITTHSMEEADHVATRAAILASRLLAIGTTQELRKRHSNEYHGHLILNSAPLSTQAEMEAVAEWVRQTCPNMGLESTPLGGQVRFVVPADAEVPGGVKGVSFVRYLIGALEENKEKLGLSYYSIGAATMERVFMSVVKDSDAVEEEEKRPWWRRL